jgi:hypothetical protein
MLSEKQLEANRLNALKSTGPKTAEGKQRSSLNATRHGLTGQVVVLPEEDMAAFLQFTSELIQSFEPADARERQLAQSYASLQWRINRAAAIEENMFALGHMEQVAENLNLDHPEIHNGVTIAKTFRADFREFDRLSMYSHRLVSQSDKVLKQLTQLQAERKLRCQKEMVEATRLTRYHRMLDTPFDPQKNGFVLTNDQIAVHLQRENLKSRALEAERMDFNRGAYSKKYGTAVV